VLQQNALSANDGFSSAEKGAALLDFVLDVIDLCQRLVQQGVAAASIEEADFGPVLRAREEFGPKDAAGISKRSQEFQQELAQLT
jgi:V/A-type H+-transporting ATPase subunit A